MGSSAPGPRALRASAWSGPVSDVRFVDAPRAELLAKIGVTTVEDLVRHYPSRYLDLRASAPLASLPLGMDATAVGQVHEVSVKRPRPRLSITEVAITDETGTLVGVWFNQSYLAQRFRAGERVAFAGKVEMDFGMRQMRNPFVERLGDAAGSAWLGRILPVHPATEGLSTNWVRRLVSEAVEQFGDVGDHLPVTLRTSRRLIPLATALRWIHFPPGPDQCEAARRRLAYDELLAIQLGLAVRRHHIVERDGFAHVIDGPVREAVLRALPFDLTDEQSAASAEILADMRRERPMNRMLLGDVGTGKTAVAALALGAVVDSGTQAAMMAPTEVLAQQYARSVGPYLDAAGISWALLTGSTGAAERSRILTDVAQGSCSVLMGTHALLTEDVTFARLTLAVVDEQHRFGVGQRLGLRGKGEGVDMLVMTATPIPRSLALTLYGDLDTSYLRSRPGALGPGHTTTALVTKAGREAAYERVREAARAGRQAYVVCALVDESDAIEAKAAVQEAERLRTHVFKGLSVGLLTGQMKPAEKRAAMDAFRDGSTQILVSTTVIEVGVDVPNATVMIVEDAERFGLAQLHQLRGRVGRGVHPGEVLLFADAKTAEGRQRMAAIVSTTDGFALAEEDLRLRGEGQILGSRQHGMPELRIASVLRDAELLDAAREDAVAIIASDPTLRRADHAPLGAHVRHEFRRDWQWVSSG
ncbi:MAG: ATP-dependent DNA helicase RecG [Coriobacteriia bacterium]|nr:ATP-dependent DNA helicase RecG [Coriobacteriia bacterium]